MDGVIDPDQGDRRLTLFLVWKDYHFHTGKLAAMAHLPEQIIVKMLRYQPVSQYDAACVLATLSILLRQDYTFQTVRVPLIRDAQEQAK